eukprot:scaffold107868_cov29-Tisochrysis_lutea.AAC.3
MSAAWSLESEAYSSATTGEPKSCSPRLASNGSQSTGAGDIAANPPPPDGDWSEAILAMSTPGGGIGGMALAASARMQSACHLTSRPICAAQDDGVARWSVARGEGRGHTCSSGTPCRSAWQRVSIRYSRV